MLDNNSTKSSLSSNICQIAGSALCGWESHLQFIPKERTETLSPLNVHLLDNNGKKCLHSLSSRRGKLICRTYIVKAVISRSIRGKSSQQCLRVLIRWVMGGLADHNTPSMRSPSSCFLIRQSTLKSEDSESTDHRRIKCRLSSWHKTSFINVIPGPSVGS